MKSVSIILSLLISNWAHAYAVEKDHCYHSYPMNFYINQKISKNQYFMEGDGAVLRRYAIFKTKRPMNTGRLNTSMKWTGTKKVKLSNGFDAEVDTWEDCI